MTVASTAASSGPYTGNGSTTAFPFSFKALTADEVGVLVNGVETGSGFTVTLNSGGNGGTVTFAAAPANDAEIILYSNPDFTQDIAFQNNGPFLPETHEEGLDRAAVRDIYLLDRIGRAVLVPSGEDAVTIPSIADRAGKIFGWLASTGSAVALSVSQLVDFFYDNLVARLASEAFKGDPGGNVMAVGLFTALPALTVDLGTDVIRTAGWNMTGLGAAHYIDATGETLDPEGEDWWWTVTANGRQFKLAEEVIRPEYFGALGDGTTDDTLAFDSLSQYFTNFDGAVIELRPNATYIVGQNGPQTASWRYEPKRVLYFDGLTKGVIIRGNGAKIKAANGIRFGSFEADGTPTPSITTDVAKRGTPYLAQIWIITCLGPIHVENVELDGNIQNVILGGEFGDVDRQIPCSGLVIIDCNTNVKVSNVYTHHHCLDGLIVGQDGEEDVANVSSVFETVVSHYNARQGLSLVGGKNQTYTNCSFCFTGQAVFQSRPRAGIDIESEGQIIRNILFQGCDIMDNAGVGCLHEGGDANGVTYRQCKIVGAYSWATWNNEKGITYDDCTIVGASSYAYGTPILSPDSTRFLRCFFSDDTIYSPAGAVNALSSYIVDAGGGPVGEFPFEDCTFDLTAGNTGGPYISGTAIWRGENVITVTGGGEGGFLNGWVEGHFHYDGDVDPAATPQPRRASRMSYRGDDYWWADTTVDIPIIAAGDDYSFNVTLRGTIPGNSVVAGLAYTEAGVAISYQMTSPQNLTFTLTNNGASPTVAVNDAIVTAQRIC